MSLLTLTTPSGSYSADLPAKRTFTLPATGSPGQADVLIPWSSPLAARITPNGGDLLLISHTTAGDWFGIITHLEQKSDGVSVQAVQPWGLLGRRVVDLASSVSNVWPGALVKAALDAGAVMGLFRSTDIIAGDTPLIASYTWSRPDAWSVITAMMAQSDGELYVDPATGRMEWAGALTYCTQYAGLLIADNSLVGWSYVTDIADQLSEVIGTYGTNSYSALRADSGVNHWPAQATVSGDTRFAMREMAEAELARRAFPSLVVEGSITYRDAALRERDYVQVLFPRVRDTSGGWGRTHTCRVLAREVDDNSPLIKLTIQAMPDEATTRVKAPGTVSKARGRFSGGLGAVLAELWRERVS